MNCWKTINLSKDFGFQRLLLISLITMISAFISFYVPLNFIHSNVQLQEDHFLLFMCFIFITFIVHKLLHFIVLIACGQKVSLKMEMLLFYPQLRIRACHSISKNLMLLSLVTPFVILTPIFLWASVYFPQYYHYFAMLAAFHTGCCVPDFIYIRQLVFAPKYSLVEEDKDDFEILIQNKH
ncbi:DUF3267 domain-containing protein [Metabacillus arenae]|uniref:DUF3267 domain-containing protein n=1 Tax=Metabacillus arenae TaxID=2771434 RepID=A0A926NMG3_9BACI|nr:DUF3267 domain-containing protein [Metabacillus arenae]MBD1380712.1 DUF3267 domain-containing protein [Metabacillus arenae]